MQERETAREKTLTSKGHIGIKKKRKKKKEKKKKK